MTGPSLKDSLSRWSGFPEIRKSFEPLQMRGAARRVTQLLGDVRPRPLTPYDLGVLYRRVAEAWNRDHKLDRLESRDLRRLPWVLFYSPQHKGRSSDSNHNNWLGANPRIIQQFGVWLSDGNRTGAILALLHEYLRVYPADLQTFDGLRQLLRNAIEHGSASVPVSPRLRRWRERCRDFALLGADRGRSFVDRLVAATDVPDDILREAGLDAGLECCEFLKSGIRSYLQRVRILLEKNRLGTVHLSRLLKLLEWNGRLRFDEQLVRKDIAEALLRPFANGPPEPEIREQLQRFFLFHFQDPRLPSGKNKWSGVPEEPRRVVIRWLVERALEQFFALIKDTALDKHWRYREVFWRAFLKQDLIKDIWFVLGKRAKRNLRRISEGKAEDAHTIASLNGAESDQSVLLLRMSGLTIAEWSHNGSCRFWLDGTIGAPDLYRNNYVRSDLTSGANFSQRHDGSPDGRWQDRIVQWLRENTRIEVDRTDYFPVTLREGTRSPAWRYPFR